LRHDQNSLSLYINVIHYSNPEANKAYVSYSKIMTRAGVRRFGIRSVLRQYSARSLYLSHKGCKQLWVWAEKDISIIIERPWWSTWWAYCIYGLLFFSAAFGIHRFQKARIVRAERERSRTKELAQAKEIEKAYTELKATQTHSSTRKRWPRLANSLVACS
jgi:hypothetical protein